MELKKMRHTSAATFQVEWIEPGYASRTDYRPKTNFSSETRGPRYAHTLAHTLVHHVHKTWKKPGHLERFWWYFSSLSSQGVVCVCRGVVQNYWGLDTAWWTGTMRWPSQRMGTSTSLQGGVWLYHTNSSALGQTSYYIYHTHHVRCGAVPGTRYW